MRLNNILTKLAHALMRLGSFLLALIFPWISFLIHGHPGFALIALMLQATVIGWIPAAIWALKARHPHPSLPHPTNLPKTEPPQ